VKYYVAYERGDRNWSAYAPDLPGVAVTGRDRNECRELIKDAIKMQLEGLREDGLEFPEPSGEFIEVA
jgi:predicted RNase H-like HicB family nuclease